MRNRAGTMPLKHRSKEATNKRPPTHGITASGQTSEEQPAPSRVQENSQDDITDAKQGQRRSYKGPRRATCCTTNHSAGRQP